MSCSNVIPNNGNATAVRDVDEFAGCSTRGLLVGFPVGGKDVGEAKVGDAKVGDAKVGALVEEAGCAVTTDGPEEGVLDGATVGAGEGGDVRVMEGEDDGVNEGLKVRVGLGVAPFVFPFFPFCV